ncbi:hypothetical protein [Mycobacterium sp. E3198]|uniref:hypothetical protein n=1 Tax=Mycobacterium sp. E3198 TaxID=1834143 RepID=UPI0012EAF7F5|nr:hypothetical protein [Mycobacterium sp. E3198]
MAAEAELNNDLYHGEFAVICSHDLNSQSSRRLCARLARHRWSMGASSPLPARRTRASVSIVRLADSEIDLGRLAVIVTPARNWQCKMSPAALPALRGLRSALFGLSLVCSPAGAWLRPGPSLG